MRPHAVILAGGAGRRLGAGPGGKARVPLAGRPLIARALDRIAPQAEAVALAAGPTGAALAGFGAVVLADPDLRPDAPEASDAAPDPTDPPRHGPLAGLLAGLDWAAAAGARDLLAVPCDAPFLPPDLAARLLAGRGTAPAAVAADAAGRPHPTVGLWSVALAPDLRALLAAGERRAQAFAAAVGAVPVVLPDADLLNVNAPADLAAAERRLAAEAAP